MSLALSKPEVMLFVSLCVVHVVTFVDTRASIVRCEVQVGQLVMVQSIGERCPWRAVQVTNAESITSRETTAILWKLDRHPHSQGRTMMIN